MTVGDRPFYGKVKVAFLYTLIWGNVEKEVSQNEWLKLTMYD